MEEEKEKLKKALESWATTVKNNTEIDFVQGIFEGALVSSPIVDKVATWLLAGTGATAALMIANIDKLTPVLGTSTVKDAIYVLIISALFGFLSKYKSVHCQVVYSIGEEVRKRLIPILDHHEQQEQEISKTADGTDIKVNTEIDIEYIIKEYCKAYPRPIRWWLKKQFLSGIADRLTSSRRAANALFWQSTYASIQFILFIWFTYVSVSKL